MSDAKSLRHILTELKHDFPTDAVATIIMDRGVVCDENIKLVKSEWLIFRCVELGLRQITILRPKNNAGKITSVLHPNMDGLFILIPKTIYTCLLKRREVPNNGSMCMIKEPLRSDHLSRKKPTIELSRQESEAVNNGLSALRWQLFVNIRMPGPKLQQSISKNFATHGKMRLLINNINSI
jgi:hypothetical protein